MKVLSFSGAATKIAAHAAHGKYILNSFNPDVVGGISSGSLIILPLLLGKHDLLKEATTELALSDIFNLSPVNKKGKITIRGYARGLTKGAFGEMGLEKTITKFVTEDEFNGLMERVGVPKILVGVSNVTKSRLELIELNKLSYKEAVQYIIASCTIPIYCNPVKIGDSFYYDGGVLSHNPAAQIIRMYKDSLKRVVSVYSRPKTEKSADWGYDGKYLGRNLSKTTDLMSLAISRADEVAERELCKMYGIKLSQHFSPSIMKGVYDVDNERLALLYNTVDKKWRKKEHE